MPAETPTLPSERRRNPFLRQLALEALPYRDAMDYPGFALRAAGRTYSEERMGTLQRIRIARHTVRSGAATPYHRAVAVYGVETHRRYLANLRAARQFLTSNGVA